MTYLPEFVYGSTDGVITTFAIISGVAGAKLSPYIVLILGISNVLADGFSMAVSSYLSEKTKEGTNALIVAIVTFMSFIAMGIIPITPFLIFRKNSNFVFKISYILTALSLFTIGAVKSGFIGGMETLIIGGIASIIAYKTGQYIKNLEKKDKEKNKELVK